MRRDLDAIAGRRFDLAIIGGGVVGAFCACDAARRGLSVLLVEARDFATGASEGMSHMVHGGIRYLAQGRVNLVRNELAERNRWRRFAPHRVGLAPFLMPVPPTLAGVFTRVAAVALYDGLGRGLQGSPGARWVSAAAAREIEPCLEHTPLAGACLYGEGRIDEPERAVLGLVLDAAGHGAVAANHLTCIGLDLADGRVRGLRLRDELSGELLAAAADTVINAAGAGAQTVADALLPGQKHLRLTRSKGVHFVTEPLARRMTVAVSDGHNHAFIHPWMGFSLIGTSDVEVPEDNPTAYPADLDELEARLRRLLPGLPPMPRLDAFAAARALPATDGPTYTAARDMALCEHADEGAAGFFAVYGGKWTTSRQMAERAVDAALARLGRQAAPCDTLRRPMACTPDEPLDAFVHGWQARLPSWPAAEVEAWATAYGRRLTDVVAETSDADGLDAAGRLSLRFAHAERHEMALTADDLRHRIGRGRRLADPTVDKAAAQWFSHSSGA